MPQTSNLSLFLWFFNFGNEAGEQVIGENIYCKNGGWRLGEQPHYRTMNRQQMIINTQDLFAKGFVTKRIVRLISLT